MSYATVAEADELLSHEATWLALTTVEKNNHLATAALWLNFSYEWPGKIASCATQEEYVGLPYTLPFTLGTAAALSLTRAEWPRVDACTGLAVKDSDGCAIEGIPWQLRSGQINAAFQNMTTPLFSQPATASDGGLTKKKLKVGSLEIERTWAEPTTVGNEGQLILTNVDAILRKIAPRRGIKTGRMPVLF